MSLATFDQLLASHGAAGLVTQLRLAVRHQLRQRTIALCSAMMRIDVRTDHVAAHQGCGAEAVTAALVAFKDDETVAQAGLAALFRVWGGGVAPFHTGVPTQKIVQDVLDVSRRHKREGLVQGAAMRLLKMHCQSSHKLTLLPAVLEGVARVMRGFRGDGTIQHWGAEALCALNGIEPSAVVAKHGQAAYTALCVTSIELAIGAVRPVTLVVSGTPWNELILELYPRQQSQA